MNDCRGWSVFLVLTCALIFLGSPGQSAQPEKGDVVGKKFEALKANLPKIIEKVKVKLFGQELKPKIEFARRVSSDGAKITVIYPDKEGYDVFQFLINLRFFEGRWTTAAGDSSSSTLFDSQNVVSKYYLHQLMRAIDKASGE
jgi:hypothetical protein